MWGTATGILATATSATRDGAAPPHRSRRGARFAAASAVTALAGAMVATIALEGPLQPARAPAQPASRAPSRPAAVPAAALLAIERVLGTDPHRFAVASHSGSDGLAGGGVVGSFRRDRATVDAAGVNWRLATPRGATAAVAGNRVVFHHGGTQEWFTAGPTGIEQGFTINRGPVSGRLTLPVGSLPAGVRARTRSATALDLLRDQRLVMRYEGLAAHDADGHRLAATLALSGRRLSISLDTHGAHYPITVDPFVQAAKLTSGASGESLGANSLAISGDTIVAGAWQYPNGDGTKQGAVYVFEKPAGGWTDTSTYTARLTDPAKGDTAYVGYEVAIDGDTIVAGGDGFADVFVKPTGGWSSTSTPTATLTDASITGNSGFGRRAVAIAGGTIAVTDGNGGGSDNGFGANPPRITGTTSCGEVDVFSRPDGGWATTDQPSALLGDPSAFMFEGSCADLDLGYSVAISGDGDTIAAGASQGRTGTEQTGTALVYAAPADGWTSHTSAVTVERLQASSASIDASHYDIQLGGSVAIEGSSVIAGAPYWYDTSDAITSGAAYAFEQPAGGWVNNATENESALLTPSNPVAGGEFGYSIAASGSTVIVGAPQAGTDSSGIAYVFTQPSGGWASANEGQRLTASQTTSGLGDAVALDGSVMVASDASANGALYVFATPAPSVTTAALPAGMVGASYSTTLAGNGGDPPYSWMANGLPGGLTLNATTGAITGTPTTAGTSSVEVTLTDADDQTATATLTLDVRAALKITTSSLPDGQTGAAYSATLAGTGGLAPYSWTATGLPDGLTLDSASGAITGTPTAVGTATVDVTITDAAGATANQTLSLDVEPPPLTITTSSLPGGKVDTAYSATLAGSGGTPPYQWSASGLPAGLTLNPSTGAISGTPTVATTATVDVTLTDADARHVTAALSLTVAKPDQHTLTVQVSGAGGTVTDGSGLISCPTGCSAAYNAGTAVTLSAGPASGWSFTGWSGACSGSGGCTVTMSADASVTATFAPIIRTLTVTRSGSGSGTVTGEGSPAIACGGTCSGSYPDGTVVTLTAAAGPNSTFTGWTGGPCAGTTAATCAVTVSPDVAVGATFDRVRLANLAAPAVTGGLAPESRLGCQPGTWNDSTVTFTYAWYADVPPPLAPSNPLLTSKAKSLGQKSGKSKLATPSLAAILQIPELTLVGAGQTYTVGFLDEPLPLYCAVTATTDAGQTLTARSATVTVNPGPPQLAQPGFGDAHPGRPRITPDVGVGGTNACQPGSWLGNPTLSYAWEAVTIPHAVSAASHLNPGGSKLGDTKLGSQQTLVITPDDEGLDLQCKVTATNKWGTTTAWTNHYTVALGAPVASAPPTVTVNTKQPDSSATIGPAGGGGIAEQFHLACQPGTWNRSDLHFSTAWVLDPAGSTDTHSEPGTTLDFDMRPGHLQYHVTVRCEVTATTKHGVSSVAMSGPITVDNGCSEIYTLNDDNNDHHLIVPWLDAADPATSAGDVTGLFGLQGEALPSGRSPHRAETDGPNCGDYGAYLLGQGFDVKQGPDPDGDDFWVVD